MPAEVEQQRVLIPGVGAPMEYRAICYSHATRSGDEFLPPWMAKDTHEDWIDARLDAVEHDITMHPRRSRRSLSWEEILHGETPKAELLLPRNPPKPQHAA